MNQRSAFVATGRTRTERGAMTAVQPIASIALAIAAWQAQTTAE
jgi:hypothetical protein